MVGFFDIDVLDDDDPFEVDDQVAHLFKHAVLGLDDVYEVWQSNPLFYPAKPPAHWLMVGRGGRTSAGCTARAARLGRSGQVPSDRLL
ncbi:MAG TPA: hypothetical protein VFA11_14255 [Acidimicrobiales bacterium]|nr:hypothetical protein [Acidimicrobiales bacterium]